MARVKKDITDMYKSPFPVALRALMSEKPITTQEKLAEITGKTRQTVSQYVNGISEPGYDTLIKIADYFDVSIDYLLGRTKDRRRNESVYDSIGLCEENITALRLAHAAHSDVTQLDKFISFLYGPDWNQERNPDLYAPGEIDEHNAYFYGKIRLMCKVLPDITDMIITIALEQGYSDKLIKDFAQLAYPDCKPVGMDEIISPYEFVDFKAHEISEAIRQWIIQNFYECNE